MTDVERVDLCRVMYILKLAVKVRACCGGLDRKMGQSAREFVVNHFGVVFGHVEAEITNPETLGRIISCATTRDRLHYRSILENGPRTTIMEVTDPVHFEGHRDGVQYLQHIATFVILAAMYDYSRKSRNR